MKKYYSLIIVVIVLMPLSILFNLFIEEDLDLFEQGSNLNNPQAYLIPESAKKDFLPKNNKFSSIATINIIKGNEESPNQLSELDFSDGMTYDFTGYYNPGTGWEYEIEFGFNADIYGSEHIAYYDLFIMLDIASSRIPEPIKFQVYSDWEWVDVCTVEGDQVNISYFYAERVTKFRLFGITQEEKVLKLDRLCFLIGHSGMLSDEVISGGDRMYSERGDLEGVYHYNELWGCDTAYHIDDGDFYLYSSTRYKDASGSPKGPGTSYFTQRGSTHWWRTNGLKAFSRIYTYGDCGGNNYGASHLFIHARNVLNPSKTPGRMYHISNVDNFDMDYYLTYSGHICDGSGNPCGGPSPGQYRVGLYDYESQDWSMNNVRECDTCPSSGVIHGGDEGGIIEWATWTPTLDHFEYDESVNAMAFKVMAEGSEGACNFVCSGYLDMTVQIQGLNVKFSGKFLDGNDYPEVVVYSEPKSPIRGSIGFDLKANISSYENTIDTVRYCLTNATWQSEWEDLAYESGEGNWQSIPSISIPSLQQGKYLAWVNATDNTGLSTIQYCEVELANRRPEINFLTLQDNDVIPILSSFDVKTEINDPDGDDYLSYGIPEIKLFLAGEESTPIIDWTDMTESTLDHWDFEVPSGDYDYGIYGLQVRAWDYFGVSIEEINILYQPDSPKVDWEDDYYINSYAPHTIVFNISKGIETTQDDIFWRISSSPGSASYINGSLKVNHSRPLHHFTFSPKNLPNGDLLAILALKDLDENEFNFITDLSVKYYLDTDYEFAYSFDYKNNSVRTNSFTSAGMIIEYESPLSFNYKFELPSYVKSYVYSGIPGYEIFHADASKKYTPSLVSFSEIYFEFNEKPYASSDYLRFNVKTPQIISATEFQEWEKGTVGGGAVYASYEIKLFSDLYFSNIICEFSPDWPLRNAQTYSWSIYQLEGTEWVDTGLKVNVTGDYLSLKFSFLLDEIQGGDVFNYKLYGVGLPAESVNYLPFIAPAIVAVVGGVLMAALRKKLLKDVKFFKKKPWVFYVIAVIAVAGASVAMFFVSSSSTAAFIIKGMVLK